MAEYEKLPDPPEKVNSGNVLARMMDGLGFRYNLVFTKRSDRGCTHSYKTNKCIKKDLR